MFLAGRTTEYSINSGPEFKLHTELAGPEFCKPEFSKPAVWHSEQQLAKQLEHSGPEFFHNRESDFHNPEYRQ